MENVIEVTELSKSYGAVRALNRLSLSVERGTILGLLGPNGAGKTTAVECMLGTRRPDAGAVAILGVSPEKHRKALFEKVGVQFQETGFPDKITVRELCQETACLYKAPLDHHELLARFHIADKEKSPVSSLSGGQRQRLFIVLALIPGPEVLFLDELTTGLDARARREVWNELLDLKAHGVSILLTSHFMDEVEVLCDRICILSHGQSVFYGTPAEAIAACQCTKLEDAYLHFTEKGGSDQ